MATLIASASVQGTILVCEEGLSVWGGVNPSTGEIVDAHHPQCGRSLAGQIVMMPTSRGSCTGSGVLLGLALNGAAPRALIFRESEEILTLGAFVAARMFGHTIAVLRVTAAEYEALAQQPSAEISPSHLRAGALEWPLTPLSSAQLALTETDQDMLAGRCGEAARVAMDIIVAMAAVQGATRLMDVSRVHIDGCIYASPAFLTFARTMADKGGRVRVPTTTNAISVDHRHWREQGTPEGFGGPASQLADAYVEMGAAPSFTCAPYLLADRPVVNETIAWAESNAVIYANSVLGARTVKHADFMDLCIALTGRAACSGVYLDDNRVARRVISVTKPTGADDAFWPLLGWLVGQASPDRIPLICGLEQAQPSEDDLKALCAAFGTTSAAPMLHIAGVTPEGERPPAPEADHRTLTTHDFAAAWQTFNRASEQVDLVALGSPHFSLAECQAFADLIEGARRSSSKAEGVAVILTLGRGTLAELERSGVAARLTAAGVTLISDLCWCSISEPVFPPQAKVLMTNSGKYAHYAPGLSGRSVRFGSLAECAQTAQTGLAPSSPPDWISRAAC